MNDKCVCIEAEFVEFPDVPEIKDEEREKAQRKAYQELRERMFKTPYRFKTTESE